MLCACPPRSAEPLVDERDPLIQKLKAERERLEKARQSTNPLADAIEHEAPPEQLKPLSGASLNAQGASFTVRSLEATQAVRAPKMALHTAERFLKVTLSVISATALRLDLSTTKLSTATREFPLARDAQRLSEHASELSLDANSARDVVLYFELPADALGPGLKLILPVGQSTLELPLR